ncbi:MULTISPECIES: DUF5701 family protein [Isoptericola]|uniref:DUF5701 family protein n=1 Tax=Isoptericola TaxID=254250 RepID=UPI00383A4A62
MPAPLPSLPAQADRLADLGLLPAAGTLDAATLPSTAARLATRAPDGALLVVHPRHLRPSSLAPHLRRAVRTRAGTIEREGFVVVDMPDADEFAPTGLEEPTADVYAVVGPDRGDDLASWSPAEAAPELERRGRTPLTLAEGLHWALQAPDVLERNRCFMTIGSRLRKPDGSFDSRTPAVWISNGTGRDGSQRRGAAKVGWCWWGNRHSWLGFASAASRLT